MLTVTTIQGNIETNINNLKRWLVLKHTNEQMSTTSTFNDNNQQSEIQMAIKQISCCCFKLLFIVITDSGFRFVGLRQRNRIFSQNRA